MSYPITPPPELVQQWLEDSPEDDELGIADYIATQAARWGADQELNECCKWLPKLPPWSANDLRKHRRPKPPSLAEEGLAALGRLSSGSLCANPVTDKNTLRAALERLQELEQSND